MGQEESQASRDMNALSSPAIEEPPLREYQRELLDYACKSNVIVFLNTGTGKTRIAVELIRQQRHKLISESKVAVFLAPTVPLGAQQADVLRAAGIPTQVAFGSMSQERWGLQEWAAIRDTNLALVMTPDVCVFTLSHAMMKMDHLGLLILDEAHHCGSNHAYAVLMQAFYHAQPPVRRPKVLGLTASPGSEVHFLQADTNSLLVAPKNPVQVASIIPRPQPQWEMCRAGSLALEDQRVATALLHVQLAAQVIKAAVDYATAKDLIATRSRFEEQIKSDDDGYFFEVEREGSGPGYKDLELVKRQVGGVEDSLKQLGPWGATVVVALDLLSSTSRLPESFEDIKPYMFAELMSQGSLGPAIPEAKRKLEVKRQDLMIMLEESPYATTRNLLATYKEQADVAAMDQGSDAGDEEHVALEEVAVRHVLLATIQAVTQLVSARPEDAQDIVAGVESSLTVDSTTSALEVRNDGGLEEWSQKLMQLVPPEALQQQVLGTPCPVGSRGARWLQGCGIPLVDAKVKTMVQLVIKAKQERRGSTAVAHASLDQTRPHMGWAAIVFATRKTTCLVFDQLFKSVQGLAAPAFSTSVFVGNTDLAINSATLSMTQAKQEEVRHNFRNGDLNVLFATSVGSEGMDFRQCHLVLAFDLPPNVVGLVQSGGRARARHSRYIIMLDPSQQKQKDKLIRSEQDMMTVCYETANDNMARIDAGSPPSPVQFLRSLQSISNPWLHGGADSEDTSFMSQDRLEGAYRVPSTGALCLLQFAQSALLEYCRGLPGNDRYSVLQPRFAYEQIGAGVSCTLYLPNNAAVRVIRPSANGALPRKQEEAKKYACLEAIKALHCAGALDDYLKPRRDQKHSRTLMAQWAGEGEQQELTHSMPKATISTALPALLQPPATPQPPLHRTPWTRTLHLYSFELVASGSAALPSTPAQRCGVLLPQAFPVEQLPAFELDVHSDGLGATSAGTGSTTSAGPQWARVCSWGPVQLSSSEASCLEAHQDLLQNLMLDVSSAPWGNDAPVVERVDRWRELMGFAKLRQALAVAEQGTVPSAPDRGGLGRGPGNEAAFPKVRHLRYMVPLTTGSRHGQPNGRSGRVSIDWQAIRDLAAGPLPLPQLPSWQDTLSGSHDMFADQVKGHGLLMAMHSGKLHVMRGLCLDLRPGHPMGQEEGTTTFVEYYKTRWGVMEVLEPQQPLLEAVLSSGRGQLCLLPLAGRGTAVSRRAAGAVGSLGGRSVHLLPQLVALYPMDLAQWQALHAVPSMLYRLEGLLCAQQLMRHLKSPSVCGRNFLPGMSEHEALSLTLTAITCASCNDKLFNLELPELLGDAVLKYAASVHAYLVSDGDLTAHEGALSGWRELWVSNEVLLRKALDRLHLNQSIRVKAFDVHRELQRGRLDQVSAVADGAGEEQQEQATGSAGPELQDILGNGNGRPQAQAPTLVISGKHLADSVEALVGVHCYPALQQHLLEHAGSPTSWSQSLDKAVEASSHFMQAAGLLPASLKMLPQSQGPLQAAAKRPRLNARDLATVEAVQVALQYKFRNSDLLLQAVTHCSYPSVTRGSFQRLEFLGDAVLGLLVTIYVLLSKRCDVSSGLATELRSMLVSNETLAAVCLSWGLHKHLRVGSQPLRDYIRSWTAASNRSGGVDAVMEGVAMATLQGQREAGSGEGADVNAAMNNVTDGGSSCVEGEVAPKALADVVEALVGAVYLDSNGDLQATMQVTAHLLKLGTAAHVADAAAAIPSARRLVTAVRDPRRGGATLATGGTNSSSMYRDRLPQAHTASRPCSVRLDLSTSLVTSRIHRLKCLATQRQQLCKANGPAATLART